MLVLAERVSFLSFPVSFFLSRYPFFHFGFRFISFFGALGAYGGDDEVGKNTAVVR